MSKLKRSKTKVFTSQNTLKNTPPVSEKGESKDDTIHLRVSNQWKSKLETISELNNVSLSHLIRTSVDKNLQNLLG